MVLLFKKLEKFSNPVMRPVWREVWKLKGESIRTRFVKNAEAINYKSRKLRPLYISSRCLLQNYNSNHLCKLDRSGVVMKVLLHDQFVVRIDALRRLTRKNRRFWGCTTKSQRVLMKRHFIVGVEINLAHKKTMWVIWFAFNVFRRFEWCQNWWNNWSWWGS